MRRSEFFLQNPFPNTDASAGGIRTNYAMFVFLPNKRDGIAAMVDVITASPGYLRSILPSEDTTVSLKLPKFTIDFKRHMESDLRRLVLSLPFSPEAADLWDGCEKDYDERPTVVSKFVNLASLEVDEAGSDFAMATTRCSPVVKDMVEFIAYHPFVGKRILEEEL